MDLGLYLTVLWRRKWVILTVLIITLGVVFIIDWQSTPTYQSSALVRVSISAKATQNPAVFNYRDELMNTFVRVANSSAVQSEWLTRLEVNNPPQVTLEAVSGTELVRVTVTSPERAFAAQAANVYADLLVEQGRHFFTGTQVSAAEVLNKQLERSLDDLSKTRAQYELLFLQTPAPTEKIVVIGQTVQEKQRTYEALLRQMEQAQLREALEADMITIIERAVPQPVQAQQFSSTLYLAAVAAALMMGLLLASTFEHFDTRLYTSKDIETTAQTQVLAKLPKTHHNHLYISKNGVSPMAESVRHLAARLQRTNTDKPHNTLVITAAESGQGATMTAANLGMALAEQGKHVALVDLNVRDPNLHLLFDLPNEKGVIDVLARTKGLDDALQFITGKTFALLSTGPVPISALQAFDHAQLGSLLSILRQRFDYVIVDAPPVEISNIAAIAPHADELILVTRRSHIRRESLQAAGEFLVGFKDKYIGLVVNEAET